MTPDLIQLRKDVDELQKRLKAFESVPQLDPQIINTISKSVTSVSAKGATSENKTVNESGAASYSVLNPPDRFIKIGAYNIPAWDS